MDNVNCDFMATCFACLLTRKGGQSGRVHFKKCEEKGCLGICRMKDFNTQLADLVDLASFMLKP